jgi:hypothetical protein
MVTTVLILLFASAIVGLVTGLFFRVWALLLVSPASAIVAATVLQASHFGIWAGVPIVIGCLVIGQLAFLAVTLLLHGSELSMQDEIDGLPGEHSHGGIGDENK